MGRVGSRPLRFAAVAVVGLVVAIAVCGQAGASQPVTSGSRPTLDVGPAYGRPGISVTIRGSGFDCARSVPVYWQYRTDPLVDEYLGDARPQGQLGAFSLSARVPNGQDGDTIIHTRTDRPGCDASVVFRICRVCVGDAPTGTRHED
jgi:hypothetical protein